MLIEFTSPHERTRTVCHLAMDAGLTNQQLADVMGYSLSTAERDMRRARADSMHPHRAKNARERYARMFIYYMRYVRREVNHYPWLQVKQLMEEQLEMDRILEAQRAMSAPDDVEDALLALAMAADDRLVRLQSADEVIALLVPTKKIFASVEALGLSDTLNRILYFAGIEFVAQIAYRSAAQLRKVSRLGPVRITEIERGLKAYGDEEWRWSADGTDPDDLRACELTLGMDSLPIELIRAYDRRGMMPPKLYV